MTKNAEHLNPFNNDLAKLEQFDLWNEYEHAKLWAKTWRALWAISFVAMVVMLGISVSHREQVDERVRKADARVMAMADQLAHNQRIK